MGRSDSDLIRPLVMMFFNQDMLEPRHELGRQGPSCWDIRLVLGHVFGDYDLFFGEELKVNGPVGSQESRYNSLYKMNLMMRESIGICAAKNGAARATDREVEARLYDDCKKNSFIMMLGKPDLDEETSFLFLSHFYYDTWTRQLNSDFVYVPLKDSAFEGRAYRTLRNICLLLRTDGVQVRSKYLTTKAIAYCQKVAPPAPRP